jgi:hypothetical protein
LTRHSGGPPFDEGADRRAGRTVWQGPEDGIQLASCEEDLAFSNDGQAKA